MARARIEGIKTLMSSLNRLENPSEIAKKAVNGNINKLVNAYKQAVHEAANAGYATGELEGSIGGTSAKENDLGVFAVAKPNGADNEQKMMYLEYGVYGRGAGSGGFDSRGYIRVQQAKHVRSKAKAICESAIVADIDRIIGEEVRKANDGK